MQSFLWPFVSCLPAVDSLNLLDPIRQGEVTTDVCYTCIIPPTGLGQLLKYSVHHCSAVRAIQKLASMKHFNIQSILTSFVSNLIWLKNDSGPTFKALPIQSIAPGYTANCSIPFR